MPEQVRGAHALAAVLAQTLRHKVTRVGRILVLRQLRDRVVVQHADDAPKTLFRIEGELSQCQCGDGQAEGPNVGRVRVIFASQALR